MVVDGVVVLVVLVVVGIVVILSEVVVVVVVVEVLVVDGVNVVRIVDRVVAALVVRLGNIELVVDGVVVDGVVQVLVDVLVGVLVNASATDLAVVVITRPRAATVALVVMVGANVVDLVEVMRGASRNCAMSRGSVPNIAPAFRIECCLMLSASVGALLTRRRVIADKCLNRQSDDAIKSANRSLTKNPRLNLA